MCYTDTFDVILASPLTVNKWKCDLKLSLYFSLKTSSLMWSKKGLQMLLYHSAVFIYVLSA